jgi:membrane fusion protein (multidrug efflux system)
MSAGLEKIRFYASVVVSVVLVVGLFFWLKGDLFGKEKIEPGTAEYSAPRAPADAAVAAAEERDVPVTMEALGSLHAGYSTNIAPQIMAAILKIHVGAGEDVKRGQLLVELDSRDIQARLNQVKKEAQAAEAALAQATVDFNRRADLFKQGVESRQIYEQYETALKVARAKFDQATEAVKQADVMTSYAKIYAPYDGRITDKIQDQGDMAQPGKPILKMYNPQRLRLEANVPESLKPYIKTGDTLKVHVDALNCETDGLVEEIVPSAEAPSRTFIAKVSVPCQLGLYEGMFGRVIIPVGTRKAILVPRSAVYNVGQVEMVKALGAGSAVEKRAVTTGKSYGDEIEILSGIKPGERVLVQPEKAP